MTKHKFLILFLLGSFSLSAQYFGRNKPRYQKFDFKVAQTEHFEIYEYLDNPELLDTLAGWTEQWYDLHQAVLLDTFRHKNPVIVYNDHAGFQQTNAIRGDISVGTGGVTEGLRNRVIYPIAATNQQTHHVLGHELVHAFQYHMIINGDSTNLRNMANLPLWMVEGLAEYLSIGRYDSQTALWMRDAIIHDYLPTIKDLNNMNKYFPYRWGQAFWSYIAGTYGDEAIQPLFMNTAKYGLDIAIPMTLVTTKDSLSAGWQRSLKNYYGKWVRKGQEIDQPGKLLLEEKKSGRMNICPVLSPNGKYVVFLSEKNLFSIDHYLADARTGKIIRKIHSSSGDGHIDQINFIESAGTFSPRSDEFAFDAYKKGRSVLVIKDVKSGKTKRKIQVDEVPAFSNPVWSPNGKEIVVCGLVNGQHDLFSIDVKTEKVTRLTNDRYSEILPNFSRDGSRLAFSTDQLSMERGRTEGEWVMNLAVMDMVSGDVEMIDVFPGADNMNPHFDNLGNLIFLSDRDGFRNMYKYDVADNKVYQMTDLPTGITGITPYAPAISVSEDRDRIIYNFYSQGKYSIYAAKDEKFLNKEVDANDVNMAASILPIFPPVGTDVVNTNLRNLDRSYETTKVDEVPYKGKFQLEYAGGSTGIGTAMTGNSSFGVATGLVGGVDLLFGDILGNNQLYTGLAMNGQIQDAAGQFSYINQKNRLGWGANFSHIPFRSAGFPTLEPIDTLFFDNGSFATNVVKESLPIFTQFQQRLNLFSFLPFSTTKRVEFGGSLDLYSRRRDDFINYYLPNGAIVQERQRVPVGNSNFGFSGNLFNVNAAYVGDNSFFGFAAPLKGWRYRIGMEQYFGTFNFTTALLDGRKYFYVKPFTLAFRGLAYARMGQDAADLFPFFAGNPFFVRGYTNNFLANNTGLVNQTVGSKIGIANVEFRLPFLGPRGIGLIPINFIPTDLNVFMDAGYAAFDFQDFFSDNVNPITGASAKPIVRAGVSFRVNVLGALILEPYWARPLSVPKDNREWVFGLNFIPGW